MPKGFKEQEKQLIQQALFDRGRQLFCKYGLQKTSIQEITKKAGIASGTFYKFYSSKEELYFDILSEEEKHLKDRLFKVDLSKETQPRQAIKELLLSLLETVETNPLIQQLYLGNNMDALTRKLSKEKLDEHFTEDKDSLVHLIELWKQQGVVITHPPEVITGILRSLFLLTLHKKEIGEDIFPQTMKLHVDLIVDGIIKKEK